MYLSKSFAAASVFWLAIMAFVGQAVAQQSRYSSGWRAPSVQSPAQTAAPSNETVERMLGELGKMIDEAERARAADPRFLSDLRDLARRYAWSWNRRIAFDDFSDGNVSVAPAWKIVNGDFLVSADRGLHTRYVPAAPHVEPAGQPAERDVGKALLGALIKEMVKPRQGGANGAVSAPAQAEPSEIGLPAAIPNAFALQLTLTSARTDDGQLEFGVGQGRSAFGYRLAYGSGAKRSLQLVRVGGRGSAIIDSVRLPADLEDGALHTVLLTRDSVGELAVSLDGKELIRVTDRGFRDPFDAFVLVNRGGEYTIRSVSIYGG